MNAIPARLVLEVVRDGAGHWDTRTIDLELERLDAYIESAVLPGLRKLASPNLIEEDKGTSSRWRLTDRGASWLDSCACQGD